MFRSNTYALSFGFDALSVGVLLSINRVVRIVGDGLIAPAPMAADVAIFMALLSFVRHPEPDRLKASNACFTISTATGTSPHKFRKDRYFSSCPMVLCRNYPDSGNSVDRADHSHLGDNWHVCAGASAGGFQVLAVEFVCAALPRSCIPESLC